MPKNRSNLNGNPNGGSWSIQRVVGQDAPEEVAHPRASSFAARFGRVILQHGIAAIPSALYHFQGRLNLYAQHVWFVSYILSHKWDEDLPYPSLGVMARCSGMSKRQLQRYSDELGRMGYLQVYQRVSAERGQEANAYDFAPLFERLEHWIAQGQPLPNAIRATNNLPASDRPGAGVSGVSGTWEDRDPSFVARYGRVISSYGVAAVPRAIFTHQRTLGLEPQQVWFATYIFSYQWDTALPYPSIVKMAEQTGYTPAYLHRIKGSLVEKGYLRLVHRTNAAGGQDSNAYDFSGLLDAIRGLLQPAEPAVAAQGVTGSGTSQETPDGIRMAGATAMTSPPRRGSLAASARRDRARGQKPNGGPAGATNGAANKGDDATYTRPGDVSYVDPGDIQYTPPHDVRYTGRGDVQYSPPGDASYAGPGDEQFTGANDPGSRRLVTPRMQGPVTRGVHEEETEHTEQDKKKDDSSHRSTIEIRRTDRRSHSRRLSSEAKALQGSQASVAEATRPTHPPYSPYIAQVVTDFSSELQDSGHILENVSQALRLWRDSGLDEREFVELLYEAKRRTRLGQSKGGARGLSNKMAYYFTCLRGLCAELQDEA